MYINDYAQNENAVKIMFFLGERRQNPLLYRLLGIDFGEDMRLVPARTHGYIYRLAELIEDNVNIGRR